MRPKLRRLHIRCITGIICLTVLFGNSDVAVLCISQNGHIAIEPARSTCCGHNPAGAAKQDPTAFVQHSHSAHNDCGSCVDIPLSGAFAGTVNIAKKVNLSFVTSTPIGPLPAEITQLSQLRLALKSFIPAPYFTPLRSIILQI
jgi:hypothetical protein